jgi:hypothetical protein
VRRGNTDLSVIVSARGSYLLFIEILRGFCVPSSAKEKGDSVFIIH